MQNAIDVNVERINLLDKSIFELIAAGEVIERPASIVKELLENSIDAGATAVTVDIKNGGITQIRVSDNGSGIESEDLKLAFLRHATSKIHNSGDLDRISTLGFRGEALASIAAVSRVQATSKTANEQFGASITLEAGEELEFGEAGCPDGTTIIVKDLFFNVPARLKFLKKDYSEAASINGIVDKLAISHSEISFKLISDGKLKLHTPGNGNALSAIHAVFGKEFSSALLPVFHSGNGLEVTGFIAMPQYSKSNRSMQHFFVNSRYVRSKTCMAAVEEGCKLSVMTGKYPACVLNISLSPESVDVNVHPAKIEVRFVNEKSVFDVVYFAVKSTLSRQDVLANAENSMSELSLFNTTDSGKMRLEAVNGINPLSSFKNTEASQLNMTRMTAEEYKSSLKPEKTQQNPFEARERPAFGSNVAAPQTAFNYKKTNTLDVDVDVDVDVEVEVEVEVEAEKEKENDSGAEFMHLTEKSFEVKVQSVQEASAAGTAVPPKPSFEAVKSGSEMYFTEEAMPHIRLLGEIFKTYLVFEIGESVFILDKHAAHERLIYEELKKSVTMNDRQVLLKPIVIPSTAEECRVLLDNTEVLEKLGFMAEEFGNHSIIVREIPMLMLSDDIPSIMSDIAKKLSENRREIMGDAVESLLHSMACRAAIKANDITDTVELTKLLKEVYLNGEIRNCPHGRPIITEFKRSELEKRFGRIQ